MQNTSEDNLLIKYIKSHPMWGIFVIVFFCVGTTWTVANEILVKPRDFTIEQLNTDLENIGYLKEQQTITIEQQKITIEQQKKEIADLKGKLCQYSEKITLQGLRFYNTIGTALDEAKNQKKQIFLYVRSDSCGLCKKFEEETFTQQSVNEILNEKFILVSLDVYKQKNETMNFKVIGTPAMIFLNSNGYEIERIIGYTDTETFLKVINELQ